MNDKKQDKRKSIIFNIIVLILIAILGFLTVFFYKIEEKSYTDSEIALNGDNLFKNEYITTSSLDYYGYNYRVTLNAENYNLTSNVFNEGEVTYYLYYFDYEDLKGVFSLYDTNENPEVCISCYYKFEETETEKTNFYNMFLRGFAFVYDHDLSVTNSFISNYINSNSYNLECRFDINFTPETPSDYIYFKIDWIFNIKSFYANGSMINDNNIYFILPMYLSEETESYYLEAVNYIQDSQQNYYKIPSSVSYSSSGFNYASNLTIINEQLRNENSNLNSQINSLNNQVNNLNSRYDLLDNQYNSLLDQYNLISQNDYTFSELFWSISAVPFGVLTSTFNVNVMGVNLAGIITGLLTSMVLLWLIKRLFK